MVELEERIREYAKAAVAAAPPVTMEEVRPPDGARRSSTPWLAVAAAVLLLAGIATTFVVDDAGEEVRAISGAEMPLTLDGHLDWELAALNGKISMTDAEIRARFSNEFVEAVPPDTFRRTTEEVARLAPWRVLVEVERRGDTVLAVQLVAAGGQQARLTLLVGADGRVGASTILMATSCAEVLPADTPLSSPLAEQLDWVKGRLADGPVPTDDELRARFSPSFLASVPVGQLRQGFEQLQAIGPYTMRTYEGRPSEWQLNARLGVKTGEEARLVLAIDSAPPHQITGFGVHTQQPCRMVAGR